MIWMKGALFALIGTTASLLVLAELPTLKIAMLLGLAIWAFCRAYYFAFYVIEHYLDRRYRFSGLWSFAVYCTQKDRARLMPRGSVL
jgi:hypothetical protein